jgi:hypothetical protein
MPRATTIVVSAQPIPSMKITGNRTSSRRRSRNSAIFLTEAIMNARLTLERFTPNPSAVDSITPS